MNLDVPALAIAVVTFGLAAWLTVQVMSLKRRLAAVPEDGDVIRMLRDLDTDLAATETAVAGLAPRLAAVEERIPYAVSHIGVVTYDAFGDITGNMSRSVAMVDGLGNGIVISLLVGRNESRFFTKQVRGRQGTEELLPGGDGCGDQGVVDLTLPATPASAFRAFGIPGLCVRRLTSSARD